MNKAQFKAAYRTYRAAQSRIYDWAQDLDDQSFNWIQALRDLDARTDPRLLHVLDPLYARMSARYWKVPLRKVMDDWPLR